MFRIGCDRKASTFLILGLLDVLHHWRFSHWCRESSFVLQHMSIVHMKTIANGCLS
jgi:hypothetical protein